MYPVGVSPVDGAVHVNVTVLPVTVTVRVCGAFGAAATAMNGIAALRSAVSTTRVFMVHHGTEE
jgi:hypothetical protein